jgi:hypothetical protein
LFVDVGPKRRQVRYIVRREQNTCTPIDWLDGGSRWRRHRAAMPASGHPGVIRHPATPHHHPSVFRHSAVLAHATVVLVVHLGHGGDSASQFVHAACAGRELQRDSLGSVQGGDLRPRNCHRARRAHVHRSASVRRGGARGVHDGHRRHHATGEKRDDQPLCGCHVHLKTMLVT